MKHISDILKESLLDDEDILIKSDDNVINNIREEVLGYLNNPRFKDNFEISDYYIDDKLDKGGYYTLCPGSTVNRDFKIAETLNRRPGYKNKEFKIYPGDCSLYSSIPEGWPDLLKIGNCSSFTYYTDQIIQQNTIPDICTSFNSKNLYSLSGAHIKCRLCSITYMTKQPTQPVYIDMFEDKRYMSKSIYISDKDNIKQWSDLSKIISNCEILNIIYTPLARQILGQYSDPLKKHEHYNIDIDDKELKKLCKINFKDLEKINLYNEDDKEMNQLVKYRGKWRFYHYGFK